MALATGAFTTYDAVANREDLTDMIYDISPTEVPFFTKSQRNKAKNVTHEWQTDALDDATTGAVLEGDVVTVATTAPTTRLTNTCQILRRTWAVTGTQQAVDHAGIKNYEARLITRKARELRRDIEKTLLNKQPQTAGDTSTARKLRGLPNWLDTNTDVATNGADATQATSDRTDGAGVRAITEAIVKSVIKSIFEQGGEADHIMVGPFNKQVISGATFTGRASARQMIGETKVQAAVDLYASDFGDFKVIPNRFQRERDIFFIDFDMVAVSNLRPVTNQRLGVDSDARRGFVTWEGTLEMRNEKAHGGAFDITTT